MKVAQIISGRGSLSQVTIEKVLPDIYNNPAEGQYRTETTPHDNTEPSTQTMNSSLSRARDNSFHTQRDTTPNANEAAGSHF